MRQDQQLESTGGRRSWQSMSHAAAPEVLKVNPMTVYQVEAFSSRMATHIKFQTL